MKFKGPDMTCGHRKASVETAIKALDESASVTVDLATKTVDVARKASASVISKALAANGFPATHTSS